MKSIYIYKHINYMQTLFTWLIHVYYSTFVAVEQFSFPWIK